MYQKVPLSQAADNKRHTDRHRQRLESTSKPEHHQPLQPHVDEFCSDSSDESHSISSSSILETRQLQHQQQHHHRNYQHIEINKNKIDPPPTTQLPSHPPISRRLYNSNNNNNNNTTSYIPPPPPQNNKYRVTILQNTKLNIPPNIPPTIPRPTASNINEDDAHHHHHHHIESTPSLNGGQQITHLEHIQPISYYNRNTISLRKTSDSSMHNARKYTSSSDPSTLQYQLSYTSIPPPPPLPENNTLNINYAKSIAGQSINSERDDRWNYAYSYASSTIAARSKFDVDDLKTIDSVPTLIIKRPSLTTEMQPRYIEEMKISSTDQHIKKPSLYTGFVTPNPIELHNDLTRQPKLSGPILIYRNNLFESIDNNTLLKELGYNPIFALPIQSIVINVEICLETAFIEMKIIFINNYGQQIKDAIFALPTINGIITNISACIQDNKLRENKQYIETLLVDSNTLKKNDDDDNDDDNDDDDNDDDDDDDNNNNNIYDGIFDQSLDEYICDLFRFPIPLIDSYDSIEICSKWQQTLEYTQGRYHLIIPLQFGHNVLPNNVNLSEIIHINITLNSFLSSIKFGSNSHNLIIEKTCNESKKTYLNAIPCEHDIESKDFHIAYYIDTDKITGTVFIENERDCHGDIGHFILYINPMTDNRENGYFATNNYFGRDIIFLIDRSGSMIGSSHSKTIQGLTNALDMLSYSANNDRFGIVCFNETQIYFHGIGNTSSPPPIDLNTIKIVHDENIDDDDRLYNKKKEETVYIDIHPPKYPLFEANKHYIENAKQFVVNYGPQGGTDIGTPLKWALKTLNNIYNERRANSNNIKSIPFVVLITDGSDYQEKQIINDIEPYCKNVRILTFGIGKYCNSYFLQLLSLKSRGWSDHAMYGCNVKNRMESLMEKCYAPILKDLYIEDGITNNNDIELYPSSICDIFLRGTPIIIYGKYKNNELPQILLQTNNTIRVSGISVNGEQKIYEFKVNYNLNYFTIPISKICIKQKLNQLTSQYWFNNNSFLKKKIINISIKQNLSSEYTSMICFECNHINKEKKNIKTIGVTNKLFGDPQIDHNISGIFDSVGQFINDDIYEIDEQCCCCINIYYKFIYFITSLSSCCNCCGCYK